MTHGAHRAVFVMSTGRCGTQWLARRLATVYGDVLAVEHEPLHDAYRTRPELVPDHIARIETTLETQPYVETGWPSWRAMPAFAEHFGDRLAIVHVTRHPIPVACSWVTHMMYRPPIVPGLLPEKVPLSPFDDGVEFVAYRDLWPGLDPFQKCLFLWTEINHAALALEATGGIQWLRIRFEDLFTSTSLHILLRFLGVPVREAFLASADAHEDAFASVTDLWWDVGSATRLPGVSDVAARLGYDLADVDEVALRHRYGAW